MRNMYSTSRFWVNAGVAWFLAFSSLAGTDGSVSGSASSTPRPVPKLQPTDPSASTARRTGEAGKGPTTPSRLAPSGAAAEPGVILVKLRKGSSSALALQEATRTRQGNLRAVAQATPLGSVLTERVVSEISPVFRVAALPAPAKAQARARAATGATTREDLFRWYRLKLAPGTTATQAIESLRRHADVEAVEPNGTWRLCDDGLPDPTTDPGMSQQWHLAAVNAPAAWQYLKDHGKSPGGSRDVIVQGSVNENAILD